MSKKLSQLINTFYVRNIFSTLLWSQAQYLAKVKERSVTIRNKNKLPTPKIFIWRRVEWAWKSKNNFQIQSNSYYQAFLADMLKFWNNSIVN